MLGSNPSVLKLVNVKGERYSWTASPYWASVERAQRKQRNLQTLQSLQRRCCPPIFCKKTLNEEKNSVTKVLKFNVLLFQVFYKKHNILFWRSNKENIREWADGKMIKSICYSSRVTAFVSQIQDHGIKPCGIPIPGASVPLFLPIAVPCTHVVYRTTGRQNTHTPKINK